MSVLRMYAIYDNKTQAFMRPWCAQTHGEATRLFMDNASEPSSMLAKHPSDFVLFYIGEFHEDNGVVVSAKAENLGSAAQYLRQVSEDAPTPIEAAIKVRAQS